VQHRVLAQLADEQHRVVGQLVEPGFGQRGPHEPAGSARRTGVAREPGTSLERWPHDEESARVTEAQW
jgi:hypothetical protein